MLGPLPLADEEGRSAVEEVHHIIGGCSLLESTDYKERHENMVKIVHIELASKHCLLDKKNALPYFGHKPSPVMDIEEYTPYWDKPIITDQMVRHNWPKIILVEK